MEHVVFVLGSVDTFQSQGHLIFVRDVRGVCYYFCSINAVVCTQNQASTPAQNEVFQNFQSLVF